MKKLHKRLPGITPGSPLPWNSDCINFMCLKSGGIYSYRCGLDRVCGSPSCIAVSRVSVQLRPYLIFRSYRSSNERGLINQVARRRNRNKRHRTVGNFKCPGNVGYPVENYAEATSFTRAATMEFTRHWWIVQGIWVSLVVSPMSFFFSGRGN